MTKPTLTRHISSFEQIRRINDTGNEYWTSRDFAKVLTVSHWGRNRIGH